MAEHSALTGSELHEPKGVAAATAGQVYEADGAGSGSWTSPTYGNIYTNHGDAETVATIGTTEKKLDGFANDGASSNCTVASASDSITVLSAGTYFVSFASSVSTVASADSGVYAFDISVNDVSSNISFHRALSGTSDLGSGACSGILALSANDVVTVRVSSDNGSNTDDLNIVEASLSVVRIGP